MTVVVIKVSTMKRRGVIAVVSIVLGGAHVEWPIHGPLVRNGTVDHPTGMTEP